MLSAGQRRKFEGKKAIRANGRKAAAGGRPAIGRDHVDPDAPAPPPRSTRCWSEPRRSRGSAGGQGRYARFVDDLVVLVDGHSRQRWLRTAIERRLREELATLQVEINEGKSRRVDLTQSESFGFLRFEFHRVADRSRAMSSHNSKYHTTCSASSSEPDGGSTGDLPWKESMPNSPRKVGLPVTRPT
jgi:hypothetical protein